MFVKIKLEDGCENFCPKKAHPDDAGYDLYSRIDAVLEPLSGMAIPVGFAWSYPPVTRHKSVHAADLPPNITSP